MDSRISTLNKEATTLNKEGHVEAAIERLIECKALMQHSTTSYSTKAWLRLPLFMQKAGRFDEAMVEFTWLIGTTVERIGRHYSHQPRGVRAYLEHAELAEIHEAMALACKREKRPADTERYANLAAVHRAQWAAFKAIEDQRKREDRAQRVAARGI
ncbi:MAG: hypothetical protein ACOZAI_05050 [Pseudomonadota bacterium]